MHRHFQFIAPPISNPFERKEKPNHFIPRHCRKRWRWCWWRSSCTGHPHLTNTKRKIHHSPERYIAAIRMAVILVVKDYVRPVCHQTKEKKRKIIFFLSPSAAVLHNKIDLPPDFLVRNADDSDASCSKRRILGKKKIRRMWLMDWP